MSIVSVAVQPELLLVGAEPAWLGAVGQAAAALGLGVDVETTMDGAIARLLPRTLPYRYVLARTSLGQTCMDVLAGLLDEGERQLTSLIVLGEDAGPSGAANRVTHASSAEVLSALASAAPDLPVMSASPLPSRLRAATLRMRFQPIVAAADLAPIGLEALARLHHPELGILHPRDFVPAALANGQEDRLSTVTAVRTMLNLPRLQRPAGLFVSLNLPLVTVLQPAALTRARRQCAAMRTDPATIVIELLETPEPPDCGALEAALIAWRAAGFRIAIDDAGPALPHWRDMLRLPADFLKLDGAMAADPAQHELSAEIVAAAQRRGLFVIAEGIADEETLGRMRGLGVDGLQGFLICRPLPAMAVPVWLQGAAAVGARGTPHPAAAQPHKGEGEES